MGAAGAAPGAFPMRAGRCPAAPRALALPARVRGEVGHAVQRKPCGILLATVRKQRKDAAVGDAMVGWDRHARIGVS